MSIYIFSCKAYDYLCISMQSLTYNLDYYDIVLYVLCNLLLVDKVNFTNKSLEKC